MSTTKNLTIDQGSVFYANLQYLDNSKNPISLSGYTLASQIRKSYYSANAASFSTSFIDSANGKFQLAFTSTQTGLIKPGRYVYDVEATAGSSTVRIFEGEVVITPGVTGNTYGTIFVSTEAIRGLTGNTGPQGNVGPQGSPLNYLVNGNSIVVLDTAGNITLPNGSRINTSYGGLDLVANPGGFVEMMDSVANTYIWIQDDIASIGTDFNRATQAGKVWEFRKNGILKLPDHGKIIFNTSNPEQYIEGTMGFHIYASDSVNIDAGSNTWGFSNTGALTFPDSTIQTTAYTNLSTATPTSNRSDFTTPPVSALNLTKKVQKLGPGHYTVANGVEGQIMYFVPAPGSNATQVYVQFANARAFLYDGTLYTNSPWYVNMFQNNQGTADDSHPYETLVTAIFTDGAWQISGWNSKWD
jgi:hypothetical protein